MLCEALNSHDLLIANRRLRGSQAVLEFYVRQEYFCKPNHGPAPVKFIWKQIFTIDLDFHGCSWDQSSKSNKRSDLYSLSFDSVYLILTILSGENLLSNYSSSPGPIVSFLREQDKEPHRLNVGYDN